MLHVFCNKHSKSQRQQETSLHIPGFGNKDQHIISHMETEVNQINKLKHPRADVTINIMYKYIMYCPVPSLLEQNSPLGFQVFLYSRAIHRFDQPITTIPSFILGNMIWLKGDFGSRFTRSLSTSLPLV